MCKGCLKHDVLVPHLMCRGPAEWGQPVGSGLFMTDGASGPSAVCFSFDQHPATCVPSLISGCRALQPSGLSLPPWPLASPSFGIYCDPLFQSNTPLSCSLSSTHTLSSLEPCLCLHGIQINKPSTFDNTHKRISDLTAWRRFQSVPLSYV